MSKLFVKWMHGKNEHTLDTSDIVLDLIDNFVITCIQSSSHRMPFIITLLFLLFISQNAIDGSSSDEDHVSDLGEDDHSSEDEHTICQDR